MDDPYRTAPSRKPTVLAARGRSVGALLAWSVLILVVGQVFAARARLMTSCRFTAVKDGTRSTTCHVEEASFFRVREAEVHLRNPRDVSVARAGPRTEIFADTPDGRVVIVATELGEETLAPVAELVREIALERSLRDYGFAHAGGYVIDGRVLLGSLALALSLTTIAIRRHRLVLDRARGVMRATTYAGFLPWSSNVVRIGEDDHAVAERSAGRARIVIVKPDGTRHTLVDEEDGSSALDETVARVARALEQRS